MNSDGFCVKQMFDRLPQKLRLVIIILVSVFVQYNMANAADFTIIVTGKPAKSAFIKRTVTDFFADRGMDFTLTGSSAVPNLMPGRSCELSGRISQKAPSVKPTAPAAAPDDGNDEQNGNNPQASVSKPQGMTRNVSIRVENEYVPSIPCEFLALSNHPEKVKDRGVYFDASVIRHKPVRLRYYHQGEEKSPPHYLGCYLVNRTKKMARMHVVEALGGPSKDWVAAGHFNNLFFFDYKEKNLGRIIEIPPESIVPLRRVLLQPNEVVSSTADLHLLSGGPVQVIMYASEGDDHDFAVETANSDTDRHARGAYPMTSITTKGSFSLDDKETFFAVADSPLPSFIEGKPNKGSYGIMYEFDITLKNPYPQEKSVSFYFQPRGGIATATFSFDDRPVSVGLTRAYKMVRLSRITLPAGGSRTISVKTMPEDASNYPIRLILLTDD
ncbi:MAG: hypothetical protein LWY06_19160 [Firmicutes bacterium]|nr:hypothetical protein [Bacillota bacterium]